MKSRFLFLLEAFSLAQLWLWNVSAVRIDGVRTAGRQDGRRGRRAVLSGVGGLEDEHDLEYYTNITLDDEVLPVLVDTGRCAWFSPLLSLSLSLSLSVSRY